MDDYSDFLGRGDLGEGTEGVKMRLVFCLPGVMAVSDIRCHWEPRKREIVCWETHLWAIGMVCWDGGSCLEKANECPCAHCIKLVCVLQVDSAQCCNRHAPMMGRRPGIQSSLL